jgi:CelD/BcsL family acetyltransferase involved in cellulose biosynthesis
VNAESQPLAWAANQIDENLHRPARALAEASRTVSVEVFHHIEAVETTWRRLSATGVESPGQNYDFIRLWVKNRRIADAAQFYVVGSIGGEPVAILPLHRKRVHGIRVFTWFPGPQAGCYAPVADYDRLAGLAPAEREAFWKTLTSSLKGADLVYLRTVPVGISGHEGLLNGLGSSLAVETLYRAQFSSWEHCDSEQRSRSRRKHDRQQGDRLAALGEVGFEQVSGLEEARRAVDVMFAQRSARFRAQGIRDAFVADDLVGFYRAALEPDSGIDVRLHVLRLDGEIVAVRYNIVHGDRMFCLISSMATCERIQSGSPGKQCLLRVMQTVFDQGISVFDMGCGHTDEKRHWCNVQIALRQHYVALTPLGGLVAMAHQGYQRLRVWAKANERVKQLFRSLHGLRDRLSRRQPSDQP